MKAEPLVEVQGLWKRYGLPLGLDLRRLLARAGLGADAPRPTADPGRRGSWALSGVDLELARGESLGLIGPNGAGKSTLLRVLAGVTPATHGSLRVRGRVFPMIELNAGLHLDLTGRENTRFLGAIMGLGRREIEARMGDIERFCEIGSWFDRPARQYSSGMLARLGFAVAVNVEADLLLIDEVLAVGDAAFQRRCFDRLERLRALGTSVILVSHSLVQVERFCERALLIEDGAIQAQGPASRVATQYLERSQAMLASEAATGLAGRPLETPLVAVLGVRFLDRDGRAVASVRSGDDLVVELRLRSEGRVPRPVIGLALTTLDSLPVGGFTSEASGVDLTFRGECSVRCTIRSLPLLQGLYTVNLKIKAASAAVLGGGRGFGRLSVLPPDGSALGARQGLVRFDADWEAPVS